MIEWKQENIYNSFNSLKGLAYFEHYKKILNWMDGKTNYLPPPKECNLDPYAECQLACQFCNVQRYIKNHREEVGEMRKLPTDYMIKLVHFLKEWGVSALCISGGGEATLHDGLPFVLDEARNVGLETSLVTNMCDIKIEVMLELMGSRWVAMSVDAPDRSLYQLIKGRDRFNDVIKNIAQLTQMKAYYKSDVDLAFKMLILEQNCYFIFDACKLAKELGCSTFHCRPVDLEREDIVGHKQQRLQMEIIAEQFTKCHEIEDENFKVFTITHKFDKDFHNVQHFKECLATPLLIPILTDGNFYTCVDTKMQKRFKVGSAFPNPKSILDTWGSDQHRQLIKSIVPKNDCKLRCTFTRYNQQTEQVVKKDSMFLNFP